MNEALAPYTAPAGVSLVDIRMDADRFPRLKNISAPSAKARIQQVVAMAYAYTGRPAEETRIQMVSAALYSELMEDKKHLGTDNITVEEVGHAVKSAILEADGDVYINIAFLYKAVCAYALGEGHEAQQTAYKRKVAARQKQLEASAAGAMLTTYAGRMINNNPLTHTKK